MQLFKNALTIVLFGVLTAFIWSERVSVRHTVPLGNRMEINTPDTVATSKNQGDKADTLHGLRFPFKDLDDITYPGQQDSSSLYLKNPANYKVDVEYNPNTGEYVFFQRIGNIPVRLPKSLTSSEFIQYDLNRAVREYWYQERTGSALESHSSGFIPRLTLGGEAFNKVFGSNVIDIRPQGNVEIKFGYQSNFVDNPTIPENQRTTPTFNFDQKIQMNVVGKVGNLMQMRVNYNTDATFDYENTMNVNYSGKEDQILRKVDVGNVSMPLSGSLITGGTNLFGVKTEMQFGRLTLTSVLSQSKGETKVIQTEGGAQKSTFDINATNYDANRHFFLSQYFRDHYDEALKDQPVVRSKVVINKIEVWVTNKSGNYSNARNILALTDLGEQGPYIYNKISEFAQTPGQSATDSQYSYNGANGLYSQMTNQYGAIRDVSQITTALTPLIMRNFVGGRDFEKIEQARRLDPSEYTLNAKLGFVSLNSALNNDEVLAVAYQYTVNGKTYQVGEFSTDGINAPKTLILKMIKGTAQSPKLPTWKLMMKNVYDLNTSQLDKADFVCNVMYKDDEKGTYINYLPEDQFKGKPLLRMMNLDNINSQNQQVSDGVFDFNDGITVNVAKGKIIFPVLEPFGSNLVKVLNNASLSQKYAYTALYDSTLTVAQQDAEHNKFKLSGNFKGSSSSDISLNAFNLTPGSVHVTAGGKALIENIDYTVDYTAGMVRIINTGLLQSGTPIQVSTESQELFSMQRKTLIGTHANYAFSDKFNMGATAMYMNESPLTQKVNTGEEPISNLILGMDASYHNESKFLSSMLDKLPFYHPQGTSSINFEMEAAQLIPGHSSQIKGAAYIDDFESTETTIDLKNSYAWYIASTPQFQADLFPEGNLANNLLFGANRAKLAWYSIDPIFTRSTSLTPDYLKADREQQSSHFVREVYESEIFPNKQTTAGLPTNITTMDLAFYPKERGEYNYDAFPSMYTAGLSPDGTLKNPETRWGGIMRSLQSTDFESSNVESIEFWVMDPFVYNTEGKQKGGDLYFDLGDVSEDVLRDSRKSFEQGLPTPQQPANTENTVWGRVSTQQSLVNAFDNDSQARQLQDVGIDGLDDNGEQTFFVDYLNNLKRILNPSTYASCAKDPSNDDYHYYRGTDYDQAKTSVLARYKKFNNVQGNSPTQSQSPESYTTAATNTPDTEDINGDNTLNETESYYQYHVSVRPGDMVLGKNYINDIKESVVALKNGTKSKIKWYQFKIPIKSPQRVVGSISDFKSIRFMRMFLRGFQDSVILRFAALDLARADWRTYTNQLDEKATISAPDTRFDVSAVSIEENGSRKPVNYVLPPGIDRVIDPQNPQLQQLNEQSMVLSVVNLAQGDAKSVYKTENLDLRKYKKLIMDVHAEAIDGYPLYDNDLCLFVRIGSDFINNYYEYEYPLKLTKSGVYDGNSADDRLIVWPADNQMNLPLDSLPAIKLMRNTEMNKTGSTVRLTDRYEYKADNTHTIYVKGNPNTAQVGILMIGIRNKNGTGPTQGLKSGLVWVDELRLSDFDEKGGWAALGRLSLRLSDLGTVSLSARTQTSGFGSIEQRLNERAKNDMYEYDISSSLELGKFFPKKSGVHIPLYVDYSKTVVTPEYNPLDPDVKLKDALSAAASSQARDSIKNAAQDYTTRKSINLTNLRIEHTNTSKPVHFYDISNFSATYSYSEVYHRDETTAWNIDRSYRGLLSYNFVNNPEPVEPFKNMSFLNWSFLKMIRDFNFYLAPTQVSYRTDMYRHYNEVQERNLSNPDMIIPTTYDKEFIWNRNFDLRHNVTKSFHLDISTQGTAQIDEPLGKISRSDDNYKTERDTILRSILRGGRPIQYHHTINANYAIPINKLPGLDWVSAGVTYQAIYDWSASSVRDSLNDLGNQITNSGATQLSGQLNLTSLYNKIPWLNHINQRSQGRSLRNESYQGGMQRRMRGVQNANGPNVRYKEIQSVLRNVKLKSGQSRIFQHHLSVDSVSLSAMDAKGNKIEGEVRNIGKGRIAFTPKITADHVTVLFKGKKTVKVITSDDVLETTLRFLMGVRDVSLSYTDSKGTSVSGFLPKPQVFGNETYNPNQSVFGNIGSSYAPGLPFVLGWQNKNFILKAAKNGWLTTDNTETHPVSFANTETFNIRINVEPIPDLRIELNGDRIYSHNETEDYQYNSKTNGYDVLDHSVTGNFSMTINTIGTSLSSIGKSGVDQSKAYKRFLENRLIIARRLANQRIPNQMATYNPSKIDPLTQYPDGYGSTSQEVLVPAFLAAYTNKDPNKVSLSPFPSIRQIMPNWRITYEGDVSQVSWLQEYITSLNFTHQYQATYDVGNFVSNTAYNNQQYGDGFSYVRDLSNNFLPKNDLGGISINEQFNPLLDVEANWVNHLTSHIGYKRNRNLSLSFSNNQLTEINSNELEIGLGYRFEKMNLILKTKRRERSLSNDLNLRCDLDFQKNKTILRQIDENADQVTAGSNVITLKTYADYMLSNRFQLRIFYDKQVTKPYTSLSYMTATTNFGVSFRFTLTQ